MVYSETDICIIGAGLVGSSLAWSLLEMNSAKHNAGSTSYKITLLDTQNLMASDQLSNTHSCVDPRVSTINQASQIHFSQINIWSKILPYAHAYQSMSVWDGHNEVELHFNAQEVGAENLGYTVANHDLLSVLHYEITEKIHANRISFYKIKNLDAIALQREGLRSIDLTLSDGSPLRLQAKLIIVADGKRSPTRQMLGITTTTYAANQTATVSLMHCEQAHASCARQIFLSEGPIALLPTRESHVCALIWTCSSMRAKTLQAMEEEAFNHVVTSHFRHKAGTLRLIGMRYSYPIASCMADSYTAPGIALAGDAAHSIHPLAGLGLNLGLADVCAVTECVKQYGLGIYQTQKLLDKYQKLRQATDEQFLQACQLIDRCFRNHEWHASLIRKIGLEWISQSVALKRQLILTAMNPSNAITSKLPQQFAAFFLRKLNQLSA